MRTFRITGVGPLDQIFTITLRTGETITWNVTRLRADAEAGAFGAPVFARTESLPPAEWSSWSAEDRATVEWIKAHHEVLDEPAIVIESSRTPAEGLGQDH